MRIPFVKALVDLADADPRVLLLTADLGWSVLEPFAIRFPDRFLNVGVAEQNMIGVATGLARQGFTPFCYSIATFASMRCFEQFRDGPVLHQLPVRVVGTGGGFSYGHAGPTHHAIEDLAICRSLPGLTVVAPGDVEQTFNLVDATKSWAGPAYLRIDKTDYPALPGLDGPFTVDRPTLIRRGDDVLLLATGTIVHEALKAATRLEEDGVSAAVALMAHLPFEGTPALASLLRKFDRIVTVEEATINGGLGSLVCETAMEFGLRCRVKRVGVRENIQNHHGSRPYLLKKHGLDDAAIAEQTLEYLPARQAA